MSMQVTEAKSAAIRQIAMKRVLKKILIVLWGRLHLLKTNNTLSSHALRIWVTKVMKTMKSRGFKEIRKSRRSKEKGKKLPVVHVVLGATTMENQKLLRHLIWSRS
jgi:hypothetical protein